MSDILYTPYDWRWIVGGDETRHWSSAVGAYVNGMPDWPYTRILNEDELTDVLAAYNLPGPKVRPPAVVSDRQFFQALAMMGVITKQEARDAVKVGAIPWTMQQVVDAISNADERFAAEMLLAGATEFRFDHPLVSVFAQAQGWTADQVIALFILAGSL
jgi:hypothetical protein